MDVLKGVGGEWERSPVGVERASFSTMFLRVFSASAILLACLASVWSIALVAKSKWELSRTKTQYMVVSSRPKVQDVAFILGSTDRDDLLYKRSEDPFGATVVRNIGSRSATSPFRVFEFSGYQAKRELDPSEGMRAFVHRVDLHNDSKVFPYFAVAVVFGLALGLLWSLPARWFGPGLLALAGVSLVKVLTACPTCPKQQILGFDSAVLGIFFFCGLLVMTLVSNKWVGVWRECLAAALGLVIVWQVFAWWQTKLTCLPCQVVAFLCAVLAVSAYQKAHGLKAAIPMASRTSWQPWLCSVLIPMVLFYNQVAREPRKGAEPLTLTAFSQPRELSVKNISELGLPLTHSPAVYYVGQLGCASCEEALKAIDAAGISHLSFAYIGSTKPDEKRNWLHIPKKELITATPSLLYVNKDGVIVKYSKGLLIQPKQLAVFAENINQFVSAAPVEHRGK